MLTRSLLGISLFYIVGVTHIYAAFNPFPYTPRISGWGAEGNYGVLKGDAMVPFLGNTSNIIFADLQGKYATDNSWFGGIGGGVRGVYQGNVLGAYAFIDRSLYRASSATTQGFWSFSPGVESLGEIWDFRFNGYIPISSSSIFSGSVFDNQTPSQFVGHQQLSELITTYTNSGPGVDAEVGHVLPGIPQFRAFVGGYHFSLQKSPDITGGSARFEYAFNHRMALTGNYTYDNQLHSTFEIGLRITFGGIENDQSGKTIDRRLLDPIYRNLATLSQGTSVVVQTSQTNNIAVQRNDVYFFTTNDGSTFDAAQGSNNCTFENPCDDVFFTQATVNSINSFTPDANLFFEPGTYNSFGGQVTLNGGQSLFGRNVGYGLSAQGTDRALFEGGISLLAGNNQLDSIRIRNSITDNTGLGSQVVGLTIQNAPNVRLTNVDIQANATESGNLLATNTNSATGISVDNSNVTVTNSNVSASATVSGNNNGNNLAAGIGVNAASGAVNSANNTITFTNGLIVSNAFVGGNNTALNFAVGVGANNGTGTTNFSNNTILLTDTTLNAFATTVQDDTGMLFASGIGANTNSGTITANNNTITLTNSTVRASLEIGFNGFLLASATGIGGNSATGATLNVTNSNYVITNSTVSGSSFITGNNAGLLSATGIGANGEGTMVFTGDTFTINTGTISAESTIIGNNTNLNIASAIGGVSTVGQADFNTNTFNIADSIIGSVATIVGNSSGSNFSRGIGGVNGGGQADFNANTFTINNSDISAAANIIGNNEGGFNDATGVGGGADANFINNTMTIRDSLITSLTHIEGNNDLFNRAFGVNMNAGGNTVTIEDTIINVLSEILGTNTGTNTAIGLNAGATSTININNSTVTVSGQAVGTNNAAGTSGGGTVNATNTTFNVTP